MMKWNRLFRKKHIVGKLFCIQGLDHPKMKLLSVITYPHVVPTL